MEIAASARRHGIPDADIRAALASPLLTQLQTAADTGDVRQLVIGPATDGLLLEIVVIDPFTDDATTIHAMQARDRFLR